MSYELEESERPETVVAEIIDGLMQDINEAHLGQWVAREPVTPVDRVIEGSRISIAVRVHEYPKSLENFRCDFAWVDMDDNILTCRDVSELIGIDVVETFQSFRSVKPEDARIDIDRTLTAVAFRQAQRLKEEDQALSGIADDFFIVNDINHELLAHFVRFSVNNMIRIYESANELEALIIEAHNFHRRETTHRVNPCEPDRP